MQHPIFDAIVVIILITCVVLVVRDIRKDIQQERDWKRFTGEAQAPRMGKRFLAWYYRLECSSAWTAIALSLWLTPVAAICFWWMKRKEV